MRRGWKIALGALAALALVLTLNTVALESQSKDAEVTEDGAEILRLQGGDLQVLDRGPRDGRPIVLLHCFTCSIQWWDELIPLLDREHRVIAVDLLGHGGSEKPTDGYSIENQAQLVAQVLAQLRVEGATVVGHSLGGTVAVALAEQSRELVDRLVIIDQAPDNDFEDGLGLLAEASFVPVLGEALWRIKMDWTIREGLEEAFAPGFDVPDEFVGDLRRMTYEAYDQAPGAEDDYSEETPLDERVRRSFVPLLAIFGSDDQIYDARESLRAYTNVPGAQTELVEGAGHSPNVEAPGETARLILGFAPGAVPSRTVKADRNRASGRGRERPRSRASSEAR
jgi:pimeloyl-ACP methyl ester carboxylesterase